MSRKKLNYLLTYIFLSLFVFVDKANAKCDFNTSEFINELEIPSNIRKISILTPKSKSYNLNFIRSLVSKSEFIPSKLKKKYKAKINVDYHFGSCLYEGKVWQNGDYKDHLQLIDGKPLRSLNIKIENGNIANAVKFKLLLPKTRNSLNEIFGSLIFKKFGFISPETFQVFTSVNNVESIMIFQEDSRKELLERNNRREGPIFEGDESILWNVSGNPFKYKDLSLSRLINRNWFLKGTSSQNITLNSYAKLQNSFLYQKLDAIKSKTMGFYIDPNHEKSNTFANFNFLLIAMDGHHATAGHNRKFYFNSFLQEFEPIYYDGDLNVIKDPSKKEINKWLQRLKFSKTFKFEYLNKTEEKIFIKDLENDFKKRVINYSNYEKKFFNDSIKSFINNKNYLQRKIYNIDDRYYFNFDDPSLRTWYLKRINELNANIKVIDSLNFNGNGATIHLNDKTSLNVDLIVLSRILARKKLYGTLSKQSFIFLPEKNNYKIYKNHKNLKFNNSEIITSPNLIFNIDELEKRISIKQKDSRGWILFRGGDFENWNIIFDGLKTSENQSLKRQRFNSYGLTGCLNFYNADFKNTKISTKGGNCEDSINIVNSRGKISEIHVVQSFQDAVDLDFSNLKINKISVLESGNDCLDVSGGKYFLNEGIFNNCSDKSISIGEKSNFLLKNVIINQSNVGIAVKDLSYADIENINIKNSEICIDAFQKKQEFGGGFVNINKLSCSGILKSDDQSKVILNKQ